MALKYMLTSGIVISPAFFYVCLFVIWPQKNSEISIIQWTEKIRMHSATILATYDIELLSKKNYKIKYWDEK